MSEPNYIKLYRQLREAIVKGDGRNMKETAFLKNNNGKYELTVMGITMVRTKK